MNHTSTRIGKPQYCTISITPAWGVICDQSDEQVLESAGWAWLKQSSGTTAGYSRFFKQPSMVYFYMCALTVSYLSRSGDTAMRFRGQLDFKYYSYHYNY